MYTFETHEELSSTSPKRDRIVYNDLRERVRNQLIKDRWCKIVAYCRQATGDCGCESPFYSWRESLYNLEFHKLSDKRKLKHANRTESEIEGRDNALQATSLVNRVHTN